MVPFVAALLRVRPQFHLVFTEMLPMLRVQGSKGGKGGVTSDGLVGLPRVGSSLGPKYHVRLFVGRVLYAGNDTRL
jgi:hypothetical protein